MQGSRRRNATPISILQLVPALVILICLLFVGFSPALAQRPDTSLESARHLRRQGSLAAASKAYEAAATEAFKSGDRKQIGQALAEGGETALAAGNYQLAIRRSNDAATAFGQSGALDEQSAAVNQVGLAYLYRGEYQRALENFMRALALDRQSGAAEPEVAHLNNVGNVYFFQGRYLEALENYEGALKNVSRHVREIWSGRRRELTLVNMAVLYEQLGQNEKALEYYNQAQATPFALPADEYAQVLSNLGTLYRRLGDPIKALQTYRSAQHILARERHPDGEIHVLHNIGIVLLLNLHNPDGGIAAFSEALNLANRISNQRQATLAHLFLGEAYYRLQRVDRARGEFEAALSGARQIGASEEAWTALFGLGRIREAMRDPEGALARYRDSIAIIESLRSGLNRPSLKSGFLANKRDVYDACIGLLLSKASPDQELIFEMMEQSRERMLQDASRSAARPTIASLQARLKRSDIVLEYWLGTDKLAVLRIARTESRVQIRAVTAKDLDSIREFVHKVQEESTLAWRQTGKSAADLLISGLSNASGVRHVFLILDGILNNVPFEALPLGEQLIVERFDISYLPSASLFERAKPARGPLPPWSRQLVAFGDPQPPARSSEALGDESWTRLPYSGAEISSVSKLLPGRAETYTGGADLKRHLLNGRATGVPILHISTHAAVDTMEPNRSRILFSRESKKVGSEYLFLKEAREVDLRGVDLITLSACETEGGRITPGEGVQSFSRSFLAAGAAAAVTTLWRVADQPTAEFMKQFYFHLARGSSKAAALRQAKLSFLRSGSELAEPRYWAAFVLNGDGRDPIPRAVRWIWIELSLVAIVLLGALGLRLRSRRILRLKAAGLHRYDG